MYTNEDFNPLLARRSRSRGLIVATLAVLGILAAGTIAVSASQSQSKSQPQSETVTVAQNEIRTASAEQGSQTRRQVRVIPLFNTPGNQTGK